ncbi:MAG: hypothetical protein ACRDD1_09785 [Planctomycetia bacterium]
MIDPSPSVCSTTAQPFRRASDFAFSTAYACRKQSSFGRSPSPPLKVVEPNPGGRSFTHNRIPPPLELDGPPLDDVGVQRMPTLYRTLQLQPSAGGRHRDGITDLRLDLNDVTQFKPPFHVQRQEANKVLAGPFVDEEAPDRTFRRTAES